MEKIKKKILKYENFFFFLFFIIVLSNSINLKTKFTTKIYTEYDDIGVIALHKGFVGDKKIDILNKSFLIKNETIKDLDQSLLFPFYISHGWTYAPGQYFIIPFLNLENKKYKNKILSVRIISLVSTILNSLLIFLICIKFLHLNKWLSLLLFCIFSFSLNSNIYANHMSPYATYSLCTTLGIFLCNKALRSKNYLKYYTFNSILIYFSYINVLFYLFFFFIEIRKKRFKETILSLFKNKKKYFIANLFFLIPILSLILIKLIISKAGERGEAIDLTQNFYELFKQIFYQFHLSITSIQTGFIPIFFKNINLFFIILLIFCGIFYSYKRLTEHNKIILEIFVLFFLFWILFYIFNKLPLDQTRHSLIFFPIYILSLGLILKDIKYFNFVFLMLIVILLMPSIKKNHEIMNSKKSNFDYNLILKAKIKDIYTFSDTLSPFVYFDKEYKIFNLDLNSFRKNFKKDDLPNKLLLVSQNQSLEERSSYDVFLKNFINFYDIETIKENYSNTFMPFDNYEEHSTENGFYLYNLNKKNIN